MVRPRQFEVIRSRRRYQSTLFYDFERRLMDCVHTSSIPGRMLQGYGEFGPRSRTWRKLNLASQRQTPSESQPLAVDASRAPSPQVDHRRDWPDGRYQACGLSVDGDQTLSTFVITLRQLDRPRITLSVSYQLTERHDQTTSYTGASMKGIRRVDSTCVNRCPVLPQTGKWFVSA